MSEVTKKIMDKVKEGTVKKIPKWRFVVKRVFVWISLFVAILLGAFSVSMMIFQIVNVDWDLVPRMVPDAGFGILKLVPYFWLFISVLLFVFVYFDFKNTRKGHRYGGGVIIGLSFLVTLILGSVIYSVRASQFADDVFLKVPFYRNMHMGREMMWNMPERGIIAGVIMKIEGDDAIVLEDMMKFIWNVNIEKARFGKGPVERLFVVGDRVKAIGKIVGPGSFKAEEIRPFKSPRP
jgi:hypothetical protein